MVRNIIFVAFLVLVNNISFGQKAYKFEYSRPNQSTIVALYNPTGAKKEFYFRLYVGSTNFYNLLDTSLVLIGDNITDENRETIEPNESNRGDFKYGKYFYFEKEIKEVVGVDLKCDSLVIGSNLTSVDLESTIINKLHFKECDNGNSNFKSINIIDSKIGTLVFENNNIHNNISFLDYSAPSVKMSQVNSIEILNCKILEPIFFKNIPYPKSIVIDNITFINSNSIIDLTAFDNSEQNSVCEIKIKNINDDISKLKMNYEKFRLNFVDMPNWKKESLYKSLLEEQLKLGYIYGYQKLDKEFKHFEYTKDNTLLGEFKDWMDKTWWEYGYNKFKVITNSLYIFLFIVLINLVFYSHFLAIYFPDKFKKIEERLVDKFSNSNSMINRLLFHIYRIPSVIVYSAYLFWGVRLEIKEIEINKPLIFVLLILEYIVGVICLAYIANYIISK